MLNNFALLLHLRRPALNYDVWCTQVASATAIVLLNLNYNRAEQGKNQQNSEKSTNPTGRIEEIAKM